LIGLLFRNFPKYVSLTVGDQKSVKFLKWVDLLKKATLQNFPSGRFSTQYIATCRFLFIPYKKLQAGSYAT